MAHVDVTRLQGRRADDGNHTHTYTHTHTHTHSRLTALFPGLPRWAGTRKVKPVWILLKQETVSGSGISWDICKSAPHSRQITAPPLSFFTGRMPFLPPNQQRQSTEGNDDGNHSTGKLCHCAVQRRSAVNWSSVGTVSSPATLTYLETMERRAATVPAAYRTYPHCLR